MINMFISLFTFSFLISFIYLFLDTSISLLSPPSFLGHPQSSFHPAFVQICPPPPPSPKKCNFWVINTTLSSVIYFLSCLPLPLVMRDCALELLYLADTQPSILTHICSSVHPSIYISLYHSFISSLSDHSIMH